MNNNEEKFSAHSAQSLRENRSQIRMRNEQKRKEQVADMTEALLPVKEEVESLVKGTQKQNELLEAQVKAAEESAIQAKKDAINAKILSWVSLSVSTILAVVSIIVSIIK